MNTIELLCEKNRIALCWYILESRKMQLGFGLDCDRSLYSKVRDDCALAGDLGNDVKTCIKMYYK